MKVFLDICCIQTFCFNTEPFFFFFYLIEFQDFYTSAATSLKQELSNQGHILDVFEVGQQGVFPSVPSVKDAPSLKVNYTGKLSCVFVCLLYIH